MILYTFHRISEKKFPQLNSMERYYFMRKRYEHLRWSLLFVGALIMVQLAGVFYYFYRGSIPLLQLLISNVIVIAIIIFLTRIYKVRDRLQDMGADEKVPEKAVSETAVVQAPVAVATEQAPVVQTPAKKPKKAKK
jgi:hypothetical protein